MLNHISQPVIRLLTWVHCFHALALLSWFLIHAHTEFVQNSLMATPAHPPVVSWSFVRTRAILSPKRFSTVFYQMDAIAVYHLVRIFGVSLVVV